MTDPNPNAPLPSANAANPLASPAILHPPTLQHFGEHPQLAAALTNTVERCLRMRTRFPHTLLIGGADSGKRSLAHAIAKDLAVGIRELDTLHVTCPEDIESVLRNVPTGGILLVTGFEHAPHGAEVDLTRAMANGMRRIRKPADLGSWFDIAERELGRRGSDFTVIGTTRRPLGKDHQAMRFFDRTYFLSRTEAGEAERLRRCLRRAGVGLDPAAAAAIAAFTVAAGIRTLPSAAMLVEHAEAHGLKHLAESDVAQAMDVIFPACAAPAAAPAQAVIDIASLIESVEGDGHADHAARGNAA